MAYRRLGFSLTPISQHSGALKSGGEVVQWGCGNYCIMLQKGYLELMGVIDDNLYDNQIPQFLERYEGIHILAFGCLDCAAAAEHLAEQGFGVNGVHVVGPEGVPRGTREGLKGRGQRQRQSGGSHIRAADGPIGHDMSIPRAETRPA